MLTEIPCASIQSNPSAALSAGTELCFSPHASNHPTQNSPHMRGTPWRNLSKTANFFSGESFAPKLMTESTPGNVPSASLLGSPSEVKSVTSNPASKIILRTASRYVLSLPNEPYSFSTCVMMIGPPRVICSGASCRPTSFMYSAAAFRKRGSLLRTFMSGLLKSQAGKPPNSHSEQMYGPGRTMTHKPSSCAVRT